MSEHPLYRDSTEWTGRWCAGCGHQWDITDPTTKPCACSTDKEAVENPFSSCRTIRRSTVAELLEGHCVFYCADLACGVHTFKAYPDPDDPVFCPACDVKAYEVVA